VKSTCLSYSHYYAFDSYPKQSRTVALFSL
jgi:hypothetical protein